VDVKFYPVDAFSVYTHIFIFIYIYIYVYIYIYTCIHIGRKFDGKWVDVKFYPIDAFSAASYDVLLPNNVVTTGGALTIEKVIQPWPGYSIPGIY
jgi:hypothetical protein